MNEMFQIKTKQIKMAMKHHFIDKKHSGKTLLLSKFFINFILSRYKLPVFVFQILKHFGY